MFVAKYQESDGYELYVIDNVSFSVPVETFDEAVIKSQMRAKPSGYTDYTISILQMVIGQEPIETKVTIDVLRDVYNRTKNDIIGQSIKAMEQEMKEKMEYEEKEKQKDREESRPNWVIPKESLAVPEYIYIVRSLCPERYMSSYRDIYDIKSKAMSIKEVIEYLQVLRSKKLIEYDFKVPYKGELESKDVCVLIEDDICILYVERLEIKYSEIATVKLEPLKSYSWDQCPKSLAMTIV